MNAFKIKKKAKTGKSGESGHQAAVDGSSYIRGISPASRGALSSFYSTGPVLSLKPIVQAKLTIGQPNDRYEQEADRVADQVMRMPESKDSLVNGHLSLGKREKESSLVQRQSACSECPEKEEIQTKPVASQITPLVQRQAEEEEEEEVQAKLVDGSQVQRQEEEEEKEEPLQAKLSSNKSPPVTTGLHRKIQSVKSGGEPLPNSVRSFFEPRFGTDFSQVRVHTNAKAAETAESINSKAFTLGKDIFLGHGQYSPGTSPGKRLMAHELTHVVQQNNIIDSFGQRARISSYNAPGEREPGSVTVPPLRISPLDIHHSRKKIQRYGHFVQECSDAKDLSPFIWPGHHIARQAVNKAISLLSASPSTFHPTLMKVFLKYFTNIGNLAKVRQTFNNIKIGLDEHFMYHCHKSGSPDCNHQVQAYVKGTEKKSGCNYGKDNDIVVCVDNLRALTFTKSGTARLIIHETAHRKGVYLKGHPSCHNSTGGECDYFISCNLSAADAPKSADSYACFAQIMLNWTP